MMVEPWDDEEARMRGRGRRGADGRGMQAIKREEEREYVR